MGIERKCRELKKLFYIGALSTLLLTACGDEAEKPISENKTNETSKQEEKVESKYPFPNSELIGDASFIISTPEDDSLDGNVPVLFVTKDDVLKEISIYYENFDSSVETYIYINEIFYTKEQVGELSQSVLELKEDNLKAGDYTITAVQFPDNDPTKKPINLTQSKFKIEEK